MDTEKLKKTLILCIPPVFAGYAGDMLARGYRCANGTGVSEKLLSLLSDFGGVFSPVLPSLYPTDLLVGLVCGGAFGLLLRYKKKHAKKYRTGEEYGSARWGTPKDIEPYMDKTNFENNILLTQTERLTMGKPSSPKYARNKNVLVIGGSGSGKTRFFAKPNLMQMHSSYVVTDPKGTVLVECGKMLEKGRPKKDKQGRLVKDKNGKQVYEHYKIKVFNTVDFKKSMHYNPFAYIRPETREQDILKFVEVLIKNTSGGEQKGEDFWVKAERLLYTAYIAMIFTVSEPDEYNFENLVDMINQSECREDDESFKNIMDYQFDIVERWIDGTLCEPSPEEQKNMPAGIQRKITEMMHIRPSEETKSIGGFACRQYRAYKLAAGKTAKSILISCSARLAPFAIRTILDITAYDELGLDQLGDELSALFIIISDTDTTFNFLVAMLYTQMFNLLCTKADNNPDGSGRLPIHVRCILDEFANIGQIPDFDKLIATIRSREISASIILQAQSQLKSLYKDNADTIIGNCDTTLFLGGSEKSTLKEMSESLGKETIDDFDTSRTRGNSESYGMNYKKLGKELMSTDELKVMDGGKCILTVRGVRPFFSRKFDITRHKRYCELLDAHHGDDAKKYVFDIERYLEKQRKKTKHAPTVGKTLGGEADETRFYRQNAQGKAELLAKITRAQEEKNGGENGEGNGEENTGKAGKTVKTISSQGKETAELDIFTA